MCLLSLSTRASLTIYKPKMPLRPLFLNGCPQHQFHHFPIELIKHLRFIRCLFLNRNCIIILSTHFIIFSGTGNKRQLLIIFERHKVLTSTTFPKIVSGLFSHIFRIFFIFLILSFQFSSIHFSLLLPTYIPRHFRHSLDKDIPEYVFSVLFLREPINKPSVLLKFSFGPAAFVNSSIVFNHALLS